jgi:cell division topological specificity factor
MGLLRDFLRIQKKNPKKSACVATERLQLLLTHENPRRKHYDFLPEMQEEILKVIAKYMDVDKKNFKIEVDKVNGIDVLELNVNLT